jgi:hypothetical protein
MSIVKVCQEYQWKDWNVELIVHCFGSLYYLRSILMGSDMRMQHALIKTERRY